MVWKLVKFYCEKKLQHKLLLFTKRIRKYYLSFMSYPNRINLRSKIDETSE
jgi:hypothetical protein